MWLSGWALYAKSMGQLICLMLMKRITQKDFYHPRHTFCAIMFQNKQDHFYQFFEKWLLSDTENWWKCVDETLIQEKCSLFFSCGSLCYGDPLHTGECRRQCPGDHLFSITLYSHCWKGAQSEDRPNIDPF